MTQKRKAITVGSKVRYTGESWYDLTNGKIYDVTSLAGDGFYVLDDVGCYNFIVSEDYEAVTDTPTLWRDMTPEEKGGVLLALHEDRPVEWLDPTDPDDNWGEFEETEDCIVDSCAYRIKTELKVEVVTSMWAYEKGGKDGFCHPSNRNATHRITFNTIDGDIPHGTYTNECGHTITVDKL